MSSRIKSFFRRISKDHSSGRSHQSSHESDAPESANSRKLSAPASLVPSKRGHTKDLDALAPAPDDNQSNHSSSKGDKFGKPKYKKMSNTSSNQQEGIPESDENMDIVAKSVDATKCTFQSIPTTRATIETVTALGSASEHSSAPQTIVVSESSELILGSNATVPSQVSATITINSRVPELGCGVSPAVDVSTGTEPSLMIRRLSNDITDASSKQMYSIKQPPTSTNEPVKSVSITKLENSELHIDAKRRIPSSSSTTNCSNQRKLSPSKNYHISSDFAPDIKSSSTGDDNFSRSHTVAGSKKVKREGKESEEDLHAKFQAEKMSRMEKMVSDLVKNAEIKKQEIAALRMEIKRLKVS